MKSETVKHWVGSTSQDGTEGTTLCGLDLEQNPNSRKTQSEDEITCPFCRDKLRLEPRQLPPTKEHGELITTEVLERRIATAVQAGNEPVWHGSFSPNRRGVYVTFGSMSHYFTGWAMIEGRWQHINECL